MSQRSGMRRALLPNYEHKHHDTNVNKISRIQTVLSVCRASTTRRGRSLGQKVEPRWADETLGHAAVTPSPSVSQHDIGTLCFNLNHTMKPLRFADNSANASQAACIQRDRLFTPFSKTISIHEKRAIMINDRLSP